MAQTWIQLSEERVISDMLFAINTAVALGLTQAAYVYSRMLARFVLDTGLTPDNI